MISLRNKNLRLVYLLVFALILSAAVYGFAAGNTVNASYAGDGDSTISGYTVDVSYDLDGTDPTLVSEVDLALTDGSSNPVDCGEAEITFDSGGTPTWYPCTCAVGGTAACDVSSGSVSVLSITYIRVIATE